MHLIDYFERGLRLRPDGPCFIEPGGRTLSYRQTADISHRVANGLHAAGVLRGDNVGLLGPNHVLTFPAVLGIVRSHGVWLPVNARNAIDESINILGRAGCRFLFVHSSVAPYIGRLRRELPLLGMVCIDGPLDGVPGLEAWALQQDDRPVHPSAAPDEIVAIRGTGGTTGLPKGVMATHRMYANLFANWFASMPVQQPPVHLVVAPLTHAAGTMTFPTFVYGGANVIARSADAGEILQLIEAYRVTQLFLTPTLIYRLLDHPDVRGHDYRSLQYLVYSAAPMSVHRLREALDVFGPAMVQLYGQTEAPFVCTCLTVADHLAAGSPGHEHRLASCGRESPFVRVEIMNDAGDLLPPNERGEIVVKGDLVTPGYYGNPEATGSTIRDGWLHTGDIGYKDEDGYFYVVDRLKDLIISGGFNLSPSEIEQVLLSHPSVSDCAVIGVPDEAWGEAVKAVVQLKPGADWNDAEALAMCRERLGGMKTPKSIEIWDDLPRSAVGKVLKAEIRQHFWRGRERLV